MSREPVVLRRSGSAADLHALDVADPAVPSLWWMDLERPAVVLGSTQRRRLVVDRAAADRHGLEVADRRSGGGAVLLVPGDATWIDVVLPASDDRWHDDVGRSFDWLGIAWVEALASLGVAGASWHDGPLVRSRWSELVCFAGLGPGEVQVAGRKVVGISQRRTRAHARFQCVVLHRWDPAPLLEVVVTDPVARAEAAVELEHVAGGIGPVAPAAIVAALAEAVARP